jgi:hypothetical protein
LWDGGDLSGKTILLDAEQGLGDTIQFIRYASIVKRCGGTVIVECPKPLLTLLEGCAGVDRWIAHGAELPAFDVRAPLLSLPGILKTTVETIPAEVPYLFAKPALVKRWRERLRGIDGFKVGIHWQGRATYRGDRFRSIPLRCFAPLARMADVRLIGLQKGFGTEQVAEFCHLVRCDGQERPSYTDLADELDRESGPFMDTAAVMKNVDLVITSDTAIAHLAGALGVPVWVALSSSPDWRWMLDRADSPWYLTIRLFRQREPGNWHGVFAEMESVLRERLSPSADAGNKRG